MIIEDLIRLGRPLLDGGMDAREILELISDVKDEKVKNFFRHVFVVEIPPEGSHDEPVALPMQVWGEEERTTVQKGKADFKPDTKRALGAPFVLPTGGNPLHPQGMYGVPVYPCWDRHLRDFQKGADDVRKFLEGRLARTTGLNLENLPLVNIAKVIHDQSCQLQIGQRVKVLGLLILVQCDGELAPYEYVFRPAEISYIIGESQYYPGKSILPRFDRILEAVWTAKFEEGASIGKKVGTCSICGKGGDVVSSYCKAWPWALPEWNCPLPHGGKEIFWVEGVALDEPCCQSLTLGSKVFSGLTQRIHSIITREIFSPVNDSEARKTVSRRKMSDLPTIYGSAYLLPVHDESLKDESLRDDFSQKIQAMLRRHPKEGPFLDKYIDTVTGFDVFLPEDIDRTDFRLTLIYFHGNPGRGDIHLRAFIQDIIPSTLRKLSKIAQKNAETSIELLKALSPNMSEKQAAYYRTMYRSIPFLLTRAYGSSYLWDQLETALRRKPLDIYRPTSNAAQRMSSLAHRLPLREGILELNDEVIFYLTFLDFITQYHNQLATEYAASKGNKLLDERRSEMAMRPWKELLKIIENGSIDELHYQSAAELGFGCGALIRQFGRLYWHATKVGKEGKDFLKHRVLTFGTDLSPEVLWKRGLSKIFDLEARYEKIHLSDDFQHRVGVTLTEFDRLHEEIRPNRDAFMAAFWSGYALQGYDKQSRDNDHTQSNEGNAKNENNETNGV
ncbi:MAG: hypothetical protein DRH11_08795 [Deltaproteobacteria bacterium]|nr:MAG: hypothetical protein DRH11_08795 [Deltaproteobacteria bacterium]